MSQIRSLYTNAYVNVCTTIYPSSAESNNCCLCLQDIFLDFLAEKYGCCFVLYNALLLRTQTIHAASSRTIRLTRMKFSSLSAIDFVQCYTPFAKLFSAENISNERTTRIFKHNPENVV